MARVLITGVTGMVGSHLCEFLLREQQCEIFGVKRWRSSLINLENVKDKIKLIDRDLTDPHGCFDLISSVRPDYVFHLAAQSYVPDSWRNPQTTVLGNVSMQLNLLEAIRQAGLDPVIQIAGSSEEYGSVLPDELPITEKNILRPLSPYAVSKVTQDVLGYQYFKSYNLKIIRTRAFNHEGPRRGEVFVTSNFAKQIAEIEAGLKAPVLYVGNLDATRDWLDVRDVVRAYWLATQRCVPGEEYVIASGISRSIREMLNLLLAQTKLNVKVEIDSTRLRPSDVERLQGDSTKFRNATGWKPEISFETMMIDLLNYWRQRIARQKAGDSLSFPESGEVGISRLATNSTQMNFSP